MSSSFKVDQFMQVKCKFQLTSETESSESIHSNSEKVRLCASIDLDKNSTLIVMICSNEASNNHIIAYYIERRNFSSSYLSSDTTNNSLSPKKLNTDQKSPSKSIVKNLTFPQLVAVTTHTQQVSQKATTISPTKSTGGLKLKAKPRVIVKQIYYHYYNEDIVAICLSDSGNKLAMITASSTIYLIPIRNILLNPQAKQPRFGRGKSMYLYDASIMNCCGVSNPIAMSYWESPENEGKSTIIVAGLGGELSFIDPDEKKEVKRTSVGEKIRSMKIIRDRFSYSLVITCENFRQFRFLIELIKHQESMTELAVPNGNMHSDDYDQFEHDIITSMKRKPIPINLYNAITNSGSSAGLQRVIVPSTRAGAQTGSYSYSRERSVPLILSHPNNLISVADILGVQPKTQNNHTQAPEPRLVRFYASKHFYYRPQKPTLVCKLNSIDPDEMITHVVLTDRFLVIATDRHRCLINSRNCCNLRNSNSSVDLDPTVKEIAFNKEEEILSLLKSPVSNDQDNIIDSFLLITTRSIYSIESRQNCRDMFINLIDSHLGLKQTILKRDTTKGISTAARTDNESILMNNFSEHSKDPEPNLMISSFLSRRDEVYERISYESRAFSSLFKLELNSLYEAYADKLMIRGKFELADRFFRMANFEYIKILGKYIRLGSHRDALSYVMTILSDESQLLDEKEREDLAKVAFECLLAKTIVERSKMSVHRHKLGRHRLKKLLQYHEERTTSNKSSPSKHSINSNLFRYSRTKSDPYQLCEHSPFGQAFKLSANTIIADGCEDDESTISACLVHPNNRTSSDSRLECERALISFLCTHTPASLYSYVITQLVDFDLMDLTETVARSDARIYSLLRLLLRTRGENRIIFRNGRNGGLADKLSSNGFFELVKVNTADQRFLEFILSHEVTKAMVKNINLTSEYLELHHSDKDDRKYSLAALSRFETYRKLITSQKNGISNNNNNNNNNKDLKRKLSNQERQAIETMFIEFLNASLDESPKDSCRLWFNYINFYLNYIGTIDELERDILKLIESGWTDFSTAITLYKAIEESNSEATRQFTLGGVHSTPLESMEKLYNLSDLFQNEFLMKLLERTLNLVSD